MVGGIAWPGAVSALLKHFTAQAPPWSPVASWRAGPESRLGGRGIRHRGKKGATDTLMSSLTKFL